MTAEELTVEPRFTDIFQAFHLDANQPSMMQYNIELHNLKRIYTLKKEMSGMYSPLCPLQESMVSNIWKFNFS